MRKLEFRVDGLTEEQWRPRKPPGRIPGIAIAAALLLAIAFYSRIPASPIVGVVAGVDFGEQSIQETGRVQAVAILNRGSAQLVITRVTIEGAQATAFALGSNSCGAAGIAPRQSCTVEVRFTSRSPGHRLAQLVIADNAADSPQRVALSGTAVVPGPPRARITPTPVEFGSREPRSTAREKVTVENVGTTPLLVRRVAVRGAPEFTVLGEDCTHQPIAPRQACTVELRFAPRGLEARRAQLVVSNNAADSPQLVPLSGRGSDLTSPVTPPVTPPVVTIPRARITPSPVDFGSQQLRTSSEARRITVDSVATAPLVISSVNVGGPAGQEFIVVDQNCTRQPVTPGQSCSIEVRFTPQSSGPRQAQLIVSGNATDSPQQVGLSGRGMDLTPPVEAMPRARITPSPVDFGAPKPARPESRQLSRALAREQVTVQNVGTAPLLVSAVDVRGTPEFTVVSEGCTRQPIRPREICTIELRFAPRGSGARRAQLVVSDNAADSPQLVPLSGRGMDLTPPVAAIPRARITPSPVEFDSQRPTRPESLQDFGRQKLRTSSQVRQVTVDSVGTAALIVSSVDVSGPAGQEFIVVDQDCTRQPVTPGQSCSIDVRFAPRGSGDRQAQLVISDNGADSPHTVILSGTMVDSSPPKSFGDRGIIDLIPKPRDGDREIIDFIPKPQRDRKDIDLTPKPRDDRGSIEQKPKPQGDRGIIDLRQKQRYDRRGIESEKSPPPPPIVR